MGGFETCGLHVDLHLTPYCVVVKDPRKKT